MASCFGKRKSHVESYSSDIGVSVYPPPIIIQRYWVIPEFIREGRQLSRALSLNLEVEGSISTSDSESSFENVLAGAEVLAANFSQESDHPDLGLDLDEDQILDQNQIYGTALEPLEIIKSNQSIGDFENVVNEVSQVPKPELPVVPAYNPVNIRPREIKKVDSTNNVEPDSSMRRLETAKTAKNQLEDLCFVDYIASNEYIEKYLTRGKSVEEEPPVQSSSGSDPVEEVVDELPLTITKEVTRQLSEKPVPLQLSEKPVPLQLSEKPPPLQLSEKPVPLQLSEKPPPLQLSEKPVPLQPVGVASKKSLAGRRRILSAPNEPTLHIEQVSESKQVKDARNRHRTSSLRVLAQTVINLMNKRGSKGREERQEANTISQLIKEMNIPSSNSSESCLSDPQHSTQGSNSLVCLKSSSVNDIMKKLSSSKKQVSFEMDLRISERKRSSRVSRRFSRLLGRNKSSRSESIDELSRKPSNVSAEYLHSEAEVDGSNTILLESQVFKADQGGLCREIIEFEAPVSLVKSFSSETLQSNFSLDQRVARTYDMQILTYDQTPIPIPNLPRGRQLQSLDNLEKCYLVISPKISSILSLCHCNQH